MKLAALFLFLERASCLPFQVVLVMTLGTIAIAASLKRRRTSAVRFLLSVLILC